MFVLEMQFSLFPEFDQFSMSLKFTFEVTSEYVKLSDIQTCFAHHALLILLKRRTCLRKVLK